MIGQTRTLVAPGAQCHSVGAVARRVRTARGTQGSPAAPLGVRPPDRSRLSAAAPLQARENRAHARRQAPDRWNKKIARRLLANWNASGGSLAQFARERGLRADRLRWWQMRLAAEERPHGARVRRSSPRPMTFVPAVATAQNDARVAERVIV